MKKKRWVGGVVILFLILSYILPAVYAESGMSIILDNPAWEDDSKDKSILYHSLGDLSSIPNDVERIRIENFIPGNVRRLGFGADTLFFPNGDKKIILAALINESGDYKIFYWICDINKNDNNNWEIDCSSPLEGELSLSYYTDLDRLHGLGLTIINPVLDKKPMIIFAIGARNKTNNKATIILEVGRDCNIDTGELLCDWSDRTISLPVDLLQEMEVSCGGIDAGPSSVVLHKIRPIGDVAIAAPDFFSLNSEIDPLQYLVISLMVWDYVNGCSSDVICNQDYIERKCVHFDPTYSETGFIESFNRQSPRIYAFRYLFNENTLSSPQVISFSEDHIPFYAANGKTYDFGGIGLDLHNCKYEDPYLSCKFFFNIVDTWRGDKGDCASYECQQYFYYFGDIVFDSTSFSNLPTDETTYTSNWYIDGLTSYTQGSAAVIIPYLEENNYFTCHNQGDDDFDGFIDMEDADCITWAKSIGAEIVDIRGEDNLDYSILNTNFNDPSAKNFSDAVCGDDNESIALRSICIWNKDYCLQFDNEDDCNSHPECWWLDNPWPLQDKCMPSTFCFGINDQSSCESYDGCF